LTVRCQSREGKKIFEFDKKKVKISKNKFNFTFCHINTGNARSQNP
jgi:hypothetical protein